MSSYLVWFMESCASAGSPCISYFSFTQLSISGRESICFEQRGQERIGMSGRIEKCTVEKVVIVAIGEAAKAFKTNTNTQLKQYSNLDL